MAQLKSGRTDSLVIEDGRVRYQIKESEVWSFALNELWLMAEWTDADGPWGDDYFYYFVAGQPAKVFESPMYANPSFIEQIGKSLEAIIVAGLANRTDLASRIVWPEELRGKPLFNYAVATRGNGLWSRLKDHYFPLIHSEVTEEVLRYVKIRAG